MNDASTCQTTAGLLLWIQDMEASEIGSILRHPAMGRTVLDCLHSFPSLSLEAQLQPITRSAAPHSSLAALSRTTVHILLPCCLAVISHTTHDDATKPMFVDMTMVNSTCILPCTSTCCLCDLRSIFCCICCGPHHQW